MSPDDTGWPALHITELEILENPDLVLEVGVRVTTDQLSQLSVRCTAGAVPAEDHLVVTPTAADEHTVWIGGLLAEVTYHCEVTAQSLFDSDSRAFDWTGPPLPFAAPAIETTVAPGAVVSPHYTAFNHWPVGQASRQYLMVVDLEGRLRWYWKVDPVSGVGIEVAATPDGLLLTAGGRGLRPTLLSPSAAVVWRGPEPTSGGVHHHDTSIVPSGDVLVLASSTNTDGVETWEGFRIETVTPYTDTVTWSWDSQQAVDAGQLPPRNGGDDDLYHANAVSWVSDVDGEGILVSLAKLDRILRLDPDSGDILWQLGVDGDFALLDTDGTPLTDPAAWFYFQHDPEYDGTRIRLHDNGQRRPVAFPYSQAMELELDHGARTARVTWRYRERGWFERFWGDVDLLSNGHMLIAQGDVNGDAVRRSAIVEIDPATNEVVHRFRFTIPDIAVYRAERIDGCALFHNRAYCSEG